jgi:ornithine cyclodeaminase/alanine dehydrogenase-like protein (mu-crystallin family)
MLLLNNQDVDKLITTAECVEALEEAYRDWAYGQAAQFPAEGRMDLTAPSPGAELNRRFTWGAMAGVLPRKGIFALRQKFDIHYHQPQEGDGLTIEKYCIEPGTYCGFIILASTRNAEPLAIINDGVIQHHRVAGTAAVAAKYLAREDARTLAIIGSGGMARSHAEAMLAVRPITRIQVYSTTPANRERFAQEMTAKLGIPVVAVASAAAALENADIIAFCTDSAKPIFQDDRWLRPGVHVTCVLPGEVGRTPERADVLILHERGGIVEQRAEGEGLTVGRGIDAFMMGNGLKLEVERQDLPTLAEMVAGMTPGRTSPAQTTYFHNVPGAGIQFAAVGAKLYEAALKAGMGGSFPTAWLLQDIRD